VTPDHFKLALNSFKACLSTIGSPV